MHEKMKTSTRACHGQKHDSFMCMHIHASAQKRMRTYTHEHINSHFTSQNTHKSRTSTSAHNMTCRSPSCAWLNASGSPPSGLLRAWWCSWATFSATAGWSSSQPPRSRGLKKSSRWLVLHRFRGEKSRIYDFDFGEDGLL